MDRQNPLRCRDCNLGFSLGSIRVDGRSATNLLCWRPTTDARGPRLGPQLYSADSNNDGVALLPEIWTSRRALQQRMFADNAYNAVKHKRDYILYLRSFTQDKVEYVDRTLTSSTEVKFEEIIHQALKEISPCIGIGGRNDDLGIPKISPDDKEWYEVFVALAKDARLVAFAPSLTEGACRKLDWILEEALAKTLFFFFPEVSSDEIGEPGVNSAAMGLLVYPGSQPFSIARYRPQPSKIDRASEHGLVVAHFASRPRPVCFPGYSASGLVFTMTSREEAILPCHVAVFKGARIRRLAHTLSAKRMLHAGKHEPSAVTCL
jgi:hypothetical protein